MKLPGLIIFDMDGLIFNTEELFMNEKTTVMARYGYVHRREDYLQTIGLAGDALQEKLTELYGPDYPADTISQETRASVNRIMEQGPQVKDGIRELLQYLKDQQISCCVASSTRHDIVARYLKLAKLDEYFTFIIGGNEVTHSKPNPEIFLLACEKGHAAPANALVLEDSENGIRAALNGGIPVICIPDLKMPDPALAAQTAALVTSAREIPALFQ